MDDFFDLLHEAKLDTLKSRFEGMYRLYLHCELCLYF